MKPTIQKHDDKGELRQSEVQKPITLCAWCHPNPTEPNISHGICKKHLAELLEQAKETLRNTKGF